MPAEITTLITGLDASERVRDRIAEILVLESAAQQVLATTASEDPDLWKLRVYVERSAPWEAWMFDPLDAAFDHSPMVNVSVDTGAYNDRSSNTIMRQSVDVTYNIDCYGVGVSTETVEGHSPADLTAATEAQRAHRLVRRFLMSSVHTYLGLRGTVGKRFPTNFESFTPPMDAQPAVRVHGVRFRLVVSMNEESPQYEPETLEIIHSEVRRAEDGQVLLAVTVDHTPDP